MANNINLLDDIWMLLPEVESFAEVGGEGRSVTSVAAEFELLTASFHDFGRQFQTTGTAIRGVQVVVVHEEPHQQMTGTLSCRPDKTGGRQRRNR
ncbi:hypothetical protein TNCV_2710591 [Trichonephila clavipes]|nr:hypothetical protein TNCV_2710591 [Trichonephila clavipes]